MSRLVLSVFLAAGMAGASAQQYPSKPVLVISSSAAASAGDAALRMVAAKMPELLGQTMVVEIRSGASGALAAQAVSQATPDGHTLLFGNTGSFVFPRFLRKNLPFDITRDFAPVSQSFSAPTFFTVHASVPVNSLQEFIDYAKKNPGKLSYASTGVGSIFHLIGEALKIHAGIDMLHVPYAQKQYPQLLNDWSAGRIQVYFPSWGGLKQYIAGGNIKVFAAFDKARAPYLPNVPQINELLPGFANVLTWWGFFGPQALPKPIAERVAAEIRRSLADKSVAPKLEGLGISVIASTPDELAAALKADLDNTGKIVKALGIKPE